MNKLFAVTFSSLVALSSLAFTLAPEANAFTLTSNCQTKALSSDKSQPELVDSSSETLIAYVWCETNGWLTCCYDQYGNWYCY
jgi:hypothetical protein